MPTEEGAKAVDTLNPYDRVEGETMAWSNGLKTKQNAQTGVYVTDIHDGDFIKVANVNFMSGGPKTFEARAASGLRGGSIEVRMDSIGGPVVAELPVTGTGGWETWQTFKTSCKSEVPGVHDLYLLFKGRKGPELFNLDWWRFE